MSIRYSTALSNICMSRLRSGGAMYFAAEGVRSAPLCAGLGTLDSAVCAGRVVLAVSTGFVDSAGRDGASRGVSMRDSAGFALRPLKYFQNPNVLAATANTAIKSFTPVVTADFIRGLVLLKTTPNLLFKMILQALVCCIYFAKLRVGALAQFGVVAETVGVPNFGQLAVGVLYLIEIHAGFQIQRAQIAIDRILPGGQRTRRRWRRNRRRARFHAADGAARFAHRAAAKDHVHQRVEPAVGEDQKKERHSAGSASASRSARSNAVCSEPSRLSSCAPFHTSLPWRSKRNVDGMA